MMADIRIAMIAIILAATGCATPPAVVTLDELEAFMADYYPVGSPGYVTVTTFKPSVEHLGRNRVKLTFESFVETQNSDFLYGNVVSSIEGDLGRSKEHLVFKKIHHITIDTSNINYEFRPTVERVLNNMFISHYVGNPILRILDPVDHQRFIPGFEIRPISVISAEI